jgi:hypothetical protein
MNKRTGQIPAALKHGAYSGMSVLPGEDPAAFKKLHDELISEYAPNGRSEEDLIETMARLYWRKQNLLTYRLAAEAKKLHSQIYRTLDRPSIGIPLLGTETRSPDKIRAPKEDADERAHRELGTALDLVTMGEVTTPDYLLDELSLVDRLDGMIDRCLKRLLFIRGVKSISSPSSERSDRSRIKRIA